MKKLFLFTWMMMLSIVAMAQSIIVVDKNGNKTSFDPAEVESVEFWNNPPSIIVNKYADTRQFTFDKIRSVTGLPNYLLVHPDTVYVSAGGGKCDFEVRSNVAFDATPSDKWISYESKSGAQQTLTAAGNDSKARVGYIALVSKDQQLKDTLWVVQAGKAESDFNYIYFYNLKCVTPDQEICVGFISNGSNSNFPGDVSTAARGYKSRFQITHYEDGKWQPVKEQMINFEPEKGSCDPTTVYTNASGEVETTFFPNNIWIGEGNVKASSSLTFDSGESWTGYATANYSFIDIYNLDNISSQKEVIRGETGIANFKLTKFVNGGWVPCVGQEIEVNFENCSFGGAKTLKASTDAAGEVTFTFSPDNNISVTECSITATCPVKLKNGRTATGVSKATFKISEKYKIECDDKGSIYCSKDGNRVLRFLLLEHSPEHGWIASQKAPACTFGATNGTVDQKGKFNDFGIVLATFTPTGSFSPTDPGSLTVRTSITYPDGGVWNGECSITILYEDGYRLECLTPEKIVEPAKTEACEFRLLKKENDNWVPAEGKEISIFVDKALSHHKTDADGKVSVDFYQNALADEVEISASFAFMDGTGYHTGQTSTKFYLARYRMLPNMLEAHIDGKQPFDFISFHLDEWVDPGLWFPCEGKKITFEATGGTVTPNSDVTAKDGYVYVNFKPEKNFQGGTVTGKCEIALPSGKIWQSEWTVKLIQEDLIQLKCLSPEQYIAPGEEKTCEFQLMHRESPNAAWEVYPNQEIVATPVNGKLNPHIWPTTDAEGKVSLNYKMDADKFEGSVEAKYQEIINGIIYCIQTKADYFSAPYKLMANVEKMYIDGHDTYNLVFYLQEYVDGQWQTCETEHEIMVEATGGTFKKVDQLGLAKPGYISINFTPEDNFKEGSVTVKSEIMLEDGRVWKGEVTTVLLLEEDCKLECLTEDLTVAYGEDKRIEFLLTQKVDDEWVPCADKTIEFSATNGSVTPYNSNKTQADGKTFTKFTLDKGKTQGTVHAKYIYLDKNDIYHHVRTDVDLSLLLYKLMANEEKMYIDGYDTYNLVFYLQEYVDGQWQTCETEHEIMVEATGGTFKKVDQLGLAKPGYISINFTPEDNFKEGSVTVKSEIMLEDGRVWKGEVTTVLLLEEDCKLECLTEDLTVAYGEDKRIEFLLTQKVDDEWVPCADKTIEFSATNGSVTPYNSNKTQADGKTFTKFTLDKDKTQGTVHAKYLYRDQDHIYHYVRTDVDLSLQKYNLECLTPDVEIKKGESADIRFRLLEFNSDKNEWVPCPNKKITFTAENGSCTPDWMETNDEGIAQAKFTPAADATQGTLTGSCTIVLDEKTHLSWSQSKTANITITDGSGGGGGGESPCSDEISDSDLKKANELGLNTYMIDGKVTKLDGPEDMIEWSVTEDIEGNRFNAVNWFKEDPVYYTTAWGTIYGFPDDMYGEEIYVSEGSGMSISFGAFIDPAAGYSETNVVDFNSENTQKAVYRLCKDANGNIFAIAYVRSKDGKEGMFKVKAKPAPANSRSRVR